MSREGGELGQGCAMMEACVGEGVGMGIAMHATGHLGKGV